MMKRSILSAVALLLISAGSALSQDRPNIYPAAILPFQERGRAVEGYGVKVSDMLFASLIAQPELFLVDRMDIQTLLDEQELNLSGLVRADDAIQIGQMTGAKILITGSIIEVDKNLYLVAKLIGTETSRVLGASVKGSMKDDLTSLVENLAAKVNDTIMSASDQLIARPEKEVDLVKELNTTLGDAERPSVLIDIEDQHIGTVLVVIDPPAQTEMEHLCRETGFEVIDSDTGNPNRADLLISGEGVSEFGMRRGNLVSVKARVEIKAVDQATGRLVVSDCEQVVVVGLSEQLAGKEALQKATAKVASRVIPKLVQDK
jgi:TolB-like protein